MSNTFTTLIDTAIAFSNSTEVEGTKAKIANEAKKEMTYGIWLAAAATGTTLSPTPRNGRAFEPLQFAKLLGLLAAGVEDDELAEALARKAARATEMLKKAMVM